MRDPFDPLTPLVPFTSQDVWRLRDAYEGTQIFGATGSGKTSGSGAAIARAFLRAGFGGLVLCAKPEERETWQRYAAQTGRAEDVFVLSPVKPHPPDLAQGFNFLQYELEREGVGAGQTENLVNLLSVVTEIAEGRADSGGEQRFWERASRQLLRNAIDLLALGKGRVSLDDLARLIAEAPQNPAPVKPADPQIGQPLTEAHHRYAEYEHWLETSFFAEVFAEAHGRPKNRRQQHDFEAAARFWLHNFAPLNDRTRSSIVATFSSVADLLTHGIAWELLADGLDIFPEATFEGGILILDLPVQEYGEVGRVVQGIWKTMFQRAVLRRNVKEHPRPVFLWADESQNFISSFDYEFQATARSARAATVYLTQNLPNYQAKLGGDGHAAALSLLGNFQTKIFHANGDHVTNQYAADTIGQYYRILESTNVSSGSQGEATGSASQSESLQYKILPADFARLRKGGVENNLEVDGIVFQGGRIFQATGDTHMPVIFRQQ